MKTLPDGRIELHDGRVFAPENTEDPTVRACFMRDLGVTFDADLRRIIECFFETATRRKLGIVRGIHFVPPGPAAVRWFTVWADRWNEHSVTIELAFFIVYPRVGIHIWVLGHGVPGFVLVKRMCAFTEESIRETLGQIDPAALEDGLVRAIRPRLPASSPKHWMPGKAPQ